MTTLGEAPSGLRDVFELCRGFERAFTNIVNVRGAAAQLSSVLALIQLRPAASPPQPPACSSSISNRMAPLAHARAQESPAANKIKEAFFSERGLAGNVQKLPLEKVFELESVKKVRAGGCQHLQQL